MQFSYLVVDDERFSRDYIIDLIVEFQPDAKIHEAASVEMALPMLEEIKPDILFLDIKMPEADGFALLERAYFKDFELVFITAYNQFAIPAIKAGATDYLLKPIKKTEFKTMLLKVSDRRLLAMEQKKFTKVQVPDPFLRRTLSINHLLGTKLIILSDIIYLKADNTYTTIYTSNEGKVVTSKPINYYEKELESNWFCRIHKSHIINLFHFRGYAGKHSRTVLMDNGEILLISRYRLNAFLQRTRALPADQLKSH